MQKFKVGDKVKVVDEEKMLAHFVGDDAARIGTVSMVDFDESGVKLFEDKDKWWYPVDCLDFVDLTDDNSLHKLVDKQ